MCLRRVRLNRKGISPVLATVIIVAVTITIAVAIAYWMGGIAGLYTRFEKIEISYANVQWDSDSNYWKITLKVKNTGSADATIDDILLNGVTISEVFVTNAAGTVDYANCTVADDSNLDFDNASSPVSVSEPLTSGSLKYIGITLPHNAAMGTSVATSGLSLEIKLHTVAGKEYPKIITLP